MPFLQGEPLDRRLRRESANGKTIPLPIPEAMRIARQMALGLSAAHSQGLVHRDIKPGNIWLETPGGRVKILDFGLVRSQNDDTRLTTSGAIVGTPAYMSPEQVRGLPVDQRSDLFSLGCVLYQMLTAKRPFTGKDTMAILSSLAIDTPQAPHEVNPLCPNALSELTMQLLAKRPGQRPNSAQVIVDALTKMETPTSTTTTISPDLFADIDVTNEIVPIAPLSQKGLATVAVPRRSRTLLLAAVVLIALVPPGWWLASVILRVKSANGPLIVEIKDPPRIYSDREAAEYVLSLGGTVRVNDEERDIQGAADLPRDTFRLTWVDLEGNTRVNDAGLAHLKDSKYLRFLSLAKTQVGDVGLAHFRDCNNLRHLDLSGTNVSDLGLAYFNECKNLIDLNLGGTLVSDAGLAHLKDCKQITQVYLDNTRISDLGLAQFEGCKHLTHLALSGPRVSDAGLAHFKDCKDLIHLYLVGTKVTDTGLAHFRDCKNLTFLGVNDTHVSDTGLAVFKNCNKLTYLNLSGTQVSDVGMAYFKDCKNLSNLAVASTQVSDAGIAHFKDCKNLKVLHLQYTRVTNTVPGDFKNCKKLSSIRLGGTKISDTGLVHFKDYKNLKELRLNNTQVSDEGLVYFKDCKNLKFLSLTRTKVTAAKIEELKKVLPKCKIEWEGEPISLK